MSEPPPFNAAIGEDPDGSQSSSGSHDSDSESGSVIRRAGRNHGDEADGTHERVFTDRDVWCGTGNGQTRNPGNTTYREHMNDIAAVLKSNKIKGTPENVMNAITSHYSFYELKPSGWRLRSDDDLNRKKIKVDLCNSKRRLIKKASNPGLTPAALAALFPAPAETAITTPASPTNDSDDDRKLAAKEESLIVAAGEDPESSISSSEIIEISESSSSDDFDSDSDSDSDYEPDSDIERAFRTPATATDDSDDDRKLAPKEESSIVAAAVDPCLTPAASEVEFPAPAKTEIRTPATATDDSDDDRKLAPKEESSIVTAAVDPCLTPAASEVEFPAPAKTEIRTPAGYQRCATPTADSDIERAFAYQQIFSPPPSNPGHADIIEANNFDNGIAYADGTPRVTTVDEDSDDDDDDTVSEI